MGLQQSAAYTPGEEDCYGDGDDYHYLHGNMSCDLLLLLLLLRLLQLQQLQLLRTERRHGAGPCVEGHWAADPNLEVPRPEN